MTTYHFRLHILCLLLCTGPAHSLLSAAPLPPEKTAFASPLDIPLSLSATFAELRSNHFHSGIDLRTDGVEGQNVLAAEDGFISRIKIEAGGYGQALYIDHPNGYTTVYAHLSRFKPDVAKYVKEQQYKQEQFAVDLFPAPDRFPVRKGERIAWSGNTGSSGGPHLHFEIRNTATQSTINALIYRFRITDHIPPTIQQIALYSEQDGGHVDNVPSLTYPVSLQDSVYRLSPARAVPVAGRFSVGIETIDMMDGTPNRDGPYQIDLWVDSTLYYRLVTDEFSFDDTRALNSLIDYGRYVDTRKMIYRLRIPQNNRLPMIKAGRDRGMIAFDTPGIHQIRLCVTDFAGNTSVARFQVDYAPIYTSPVSDEVVRLLHPYRYTQEQYIAGVGIRVTIPAYALYDEEYIRCIMQPRPEGMFSPAYLIHDSHVPLHKRITISMDADIPEAWQSKALLLLCAQDGTVQSVGGTYRQGAVTGSSYQFGTYTVGIDTIPPEIRPTGVLQDARLTDRASISFVITDDLSGIRTYRGTIDGQWVLFSWDAKTNTITHTFDEHCPPEGKRHELMLTVSDEKNNQAVYQASFIR